jgi:hypothetical protein
MAICLLKSYCYPKEKRNFLTPVFAEKAPHFLAQQKPAISDKLVDLSDQRYYQQIPLIHY